MSGRSANKQRAATSTYETKAGEKARARQPTIWERPNVDPRAAFDGEALLTSIIFTLGTERCATPGNEDAAW